MNRTDIQAMASALRCGSAPAESWCDEHGCVAIAAAATGILPEDSFDRQPIVSKDLIFAAQARIDNRDEILERIGTPRAQRAGVADSEVLHRAYRLWGEDCVQQLAGDYAFVAFHRDSGRTVAAVDHLGSVRLYFTEQNGALILAAQLNALLAHSRVPHEPDLAALGLLMAPKMVPGATAFRHVRSLVGGHLLIREGGHTEMRRWWNPATEAGTRYRDPRDYVCHAKEVFGRAVADRLRAKCGVNTTLSGGLDSTLVSATAAIRLGAQGRTITAFTSIPEPGLACIVRPNCEPNDWDYAAAVAAMHDNMLHVSVTPRGRCTLDILDAIHGCSRTPMRNGANHVWFTEIGTRSAQAGARVLLTGERGNATISYSGEGGFRNFFRHRKWTSALRLGLQSARGTADRARDRARPGEMFLTAEFRREHAATLDSRAPGTGDRSGMIRFMKNPLRIWGADPLPQWNVEVRDPTGDRRLIECLLSFPREAFLIGGRRRGLARAMGEGLIADAVRLRASRGEQTPELASIISAHAPAYKAALETAAQSPLYRAMIDVAETHASLDRIIAGCASASEPATLDRVTEVGLFISGATW